MHFCAARLTSDLECFCVEGERAPLYSQPSTYEEEVVEERGGGHIMAQRILL